MISSTLPSQLRSVSDSSASCMIRHVGEPQFRSRRFRAFCFPGAAISGLPSRAKPSPTIKPVTLLLVLLPQNAHMIDEKKLELAGPISVIAAIACAELGSRALASWPTSSALWYLNLEVFRAFEYSLNGTVERLMTDGIAQASFVAAALFGLVCVSLMVKVRLASALASNLSLLYSGLLLLGAYVASNPVAAGSFSVSGLWTPSCLLAGAIVLVSLVSSAISHRSYWRTIFA